MMPSTTPDFLSLFVRSPELVDSALRRMQLYSKFLRFQQEELITNLVPIESEWLINKRKEFVGDQSLVTLLKTRFWSSEDLDFHLLRPEALRRFALQMFGPGLEELFLASRGGHDQVIYSLLRVRDPGLAQELWIRLEENESTFAELASFYGEGPEASRKGLMGPTPMGGIIPQELAHLLRTLQPGEVHPPRKMGEWLLLLRLENLTPARFDSPMRHFLLNQQLDSFLNDRVQSILNGETPPNLEFDIQS